MFVVDDALLLAVLAATADDEIQTIAAEGEVFTTGSWFWRLGRALHDAASAGALSRALTVLAPVEDLRDQMS